MGVQLVRIPGKTSQKYADKLIVDCDVNVDGKARTEWISALKHVQLKTRREEAAVCLISSPAHG